MRRLLITFFSLLALIVIVCLLMPQEGPKGDLAVIFLGVTNNPVRSLRPVRLEMFQGTTGLCAVFDVKSLATNRFIQFEQEAIERREGREWKTSSRTAKHSGGISGMRWTPGYKCLYALPWPAELSTNAAWRAVLSVQRETGGFRLWVNNRTRRDIFKLPTFGKHTVYSSEVEASVEFVMKK